MKLSLLFALLALFPAVVLKSAFANSQVRVATWNIQSVGTPGTVEYDAALEILQRIDADVVAINEVASDGDVTNFESLATAAGYPYTVVPSSNSFGSERNAFMSRFAIVASTIHTAPSLSGDPDANDITRFVVEVVVDVPGNDEDLTLITQHWKSGTGNEDEFRRAVESIRITQAVSELLTSDQAVVIMGDLEEEIESVPRSPNPFTELPAGLPSAFVLGDDIAAELAGPGIVNDPFHYILDNISDGVQVLGALQLDGSDATRPTSGRRLDYVMVSSQFAPDTPAEVYDSADEGLVGGLPKFGAPPQPNASADASDHLPVFTDILVPGSGTVPTLISKFEAAVAPGVVELSWNVVADLEPLTGFRVLRREGDGPWIDISGSRLIPPDVGSFVDGTVRPGQTYHYRLLVVESDGSETASTERQVYVAELRLDLEQNYPNPFNPSTLISFTVPRRTLVTLAVFDVTGRHVTTLINEMHSGGRSTVTWDGRDAAGRAVASGVYYYRLRVGEQLRTRKLVVIR